MTPAYQIKLPQFEGPFDLLLFFIERDELDIYNIPIQRITDDFLAYLRDMERLHIDLASEFILFVATLMRIKARMLLPRREIDTVGHEMDPRTELVDKILEYKRFKDAAAQMGVFESERAMRHSRGNAKAELQAIGAALGEGSEMQTISAYKLMQAYDRVLRRMAQRLNKPQHVVVKYNYSMEGQRAALIEHMQAVFSTTFYDLIARCDNRIHAIFTFLALLELVQQQQIRLLVGVGRNQFWIEHIPVETSSQTTE